jgi:hypothetical protein
MRALAGLFGLVLIGLTSVAVSSEPLTFHNAAWAPVDQGLLVEPPVPQSLGAPQAPLQTPDQKDSPCQKCRRSCCCGPCISVFAEYLYLTARDAEVTYAIPIDGPIVAGDPRIPVGPAAIVDPGYESGFRVGFGVPVDCCADLILSYTWYESSTVDAINAVGTDVINPLVIHPSTVNAATDVLNASARLDIDFEFVDLDFKSLWCEFGCGRMNYLLGLRYGHLDQNFRSQFNFNGTTNVLSDVNFDGGGIRLGLEGERRCWGCFLLYGKGVANFLAGDFNGRYFQSDAFDPVVADVRWSASRVVTILEAELGIGWQSCDCRCRVTAGYVFQGWLNAVQPDEMIQAGQTNNFAGLGDGLSFDGLAVRAEYRF